MNAEEAKQKLIEGNRKYLSAATNPGDISPNIRQKTTRDGQHPYAVILCCSDSREIPEAIFSAGIGELFVIRVAGNVVGPQLLGSIEYAIGHLGCPLIVVLGHNHCGAVDAALHHNTDGNIRSVLREIREAIGDEKDEYLSSCLNVRHSVERILKDADMQSLVEKGLQVVGAIYHLEDGRVEFL